MVLRFAKSAMLWERVKCSTQPPAELADGTFSRMLARRPARALRRVPARPQERASSGVGASSSSYEKNSTPAGSATSTGSVRGSSRNASSCSGTNSQ